MDEAVRFNFMQAAWFLRHHKYIVTRDDKLREEGYFYRIKGPVISYVSQKGVIEYATQVWLALREQEEQKEDMSHGYN